MELELGYTVAIVLGLCQVAKVAGLNNRWIPLFGVAIGVVSSFFIPGVSLLDGVVAALTASGLYSGTKNTMQ